MKYGIIIVTPIREEKDRSFINIGDSIQSLCIYNLYKDMGIDDKDIVYLNFRDIPAYTGEYVILPININLSLNWIIDIIPMPSRIIPVFLGLSFFASDSFPKRIVDYFKDYAPIGCRDEKTLLTMRKNGIPAFLFGCMSLLLPKRDSGDKKDSIFYVDVPQSFIDYSSDFISANRDRVTFLSHILDDPQTRNIDFCRSIGERVINRYKEEASLVITSRLHCMAPCLAMGIPVIPVSDNISPRMGFVDRFVKIYSPKEYDQVSIAGSVVDYENIKLKMKSLAIKRISDAAEKYSYAFDLSYFYETGTRSNYGNYYLEKLDNANFCDKSKYVIWGAGQIGIHLFDIINDRYPSAKCIGVYDSYSEGMFGGIEIEKPENLAKHDKNVFILIATKSGEKAARKMMSELGKIEFRDYICLGTDVG